MEQCTPLYKPTNRAEKRMMCFEYEKVFTPLWEIEQAFYTDLFSEKYEYEFLYLGYLDFYNKKLAQIKKNFGLKYWALNEKYFNQLFAPIPNA